MVFEAVTRCLTQSVHIHTNITHYCVHVPFTSAFDLTCFSSLSSERLCIFCPHGAIYTESEKLDSVSFEHNFCKYCLILIILSLLQTEFICPQMYNWICHFSYSLLSHYLEKYNHIHFFTETVEICNACSNLKFHYYYITGNSGDISYCLLQWWFVTSQWHHTDVIVYLFTVPVNFNLVYIKLWGLVLKIKLWSKTCMIQPAIHDILSTACELTNTVLCPYLLLSVWLVWLIHL